MTIITQRTRLQDMIDRIDHKLEGLARLQFEIYTEERTAAGISGQFAGRYKEYSQFDYIKISEYGSAEFWRCGRGEPDEMCWEIKIDPDILKGDFVSFRARCNEDFSKMKKSLEEKLELSKEVERAKLLARLKELE
jgi:hypothetical protein